MNSAYRVMSAGRRAQIVRTANPDAALERLETHAHTFGAPHGLRSAGNLAVREIRLNQVDQRSTRFARIGRRQGMRENARLHLVAPGRIAENGALELVE